MAYGFITADGLAQRLRQRLLILEDARLFYEVVGSEETMLVLHGRPGLCHEYLQPRLGVFISLNTMIYYDQSVTGC